MAQNGLAQMVARHVAEEMAMIERQTAEIETFGRCTDILCGFTAFDCAEAMTRRLIPGPCCSNCHHKVRRG